MRGSEYITLHYRAADVVQHPAVTKYSRGHAVNLPALVCHFQTCHRLSGQLTFCQT